MEIENLLWQDIVEKELRELKKDARWFPIFTEFNDTYNSHVTVKMSSSVEKRAWIFVKWNGSTGENNWAIHLDEPQAIELMIALDRFLKSD